MNKAIASLAIIKVNWDEQKKDYIQNFVPFIIALIRKKRYSVIEIDSVISDFQAEFGLVIPYHPMITILERVRKQGYIQKNKLGKYAPITEKIVEDDFYEVALAQEQKYSNILKKFIEYCKEKGEMIPEAQADAIMISFFKDHDLDVLFASIGDDHTLIPSLDTSRENNTFVKTYLINSFLIDAYDRDPETFGFIVDLSIGHLMASTLLYTQDYQNFQGRFNGNYYLDTGLLFNIVGINGPDKKIAYEEFIKLLQNNGASVYVFHHTYEEFIGILETCMDWVERPYIDPVKASRSLLYFIDNGYTSSDVERFINKIGDKLEVLKIMRISTPDPNVDTRYQIDEAELEEIIVETYQGNAPFFDRDEKEYTIQQDIKSLAAIFKLRRGEKPLKISDVKHLLITTNAKLASISREYELSHSSDTNFFFMPICLTDVFIGTLVWINSPAKVLEINQKRLIANCYAALQPSKILIRKFVGEIEKLSSQGEISAEEASVLKLSRTSRNLLMDETMGDPERFSDKTVTEILAEMRENIRIEETKKLDREKIQTKEEQERLNKIIEELELEKNQKDNQYVEDLQQKVNEISQVKIERDTLEANVTNLVKNTARLIAGGLYLVSIFTILVAGIIQVSPQSIPLIPPIATGLKVLAAILGVVSLINGFNVNGARDRFQKWIEVRLFRFFKK